MLGEGIPQLIRGKYFREILARDVKGFYFRRGGGVRMEREMERYIHTIHAPADISQGGVHALFWCCIKATVNLFRQLL